MNKEKNLVLMALIVCFLTAIGYDELRCMFGLAKCTCIINDDGYNLTWVLHLIGVFYFISILTLFLIICIPGDNNEQDNLYNAQHEVWELILILMASAVLWSLGLFFLLNCRLI